jgi:hypothetical protein
MNIPHDLIVKIMNSQTTKLAEIKRLVTEELEYIKETTIKELNNKIDDITKDPFNHYVTVPFKNYNPSDRIFIDILKKEYFQAFQHPLQINQDGYIVLIISSHFYIQNDPRPLLKQSLCPASQEMKENGSFHSNLSAEDTSADLNIFSDKEKSEYEKKMDKPPPLVRDIPLTTPRKNSLFLERQKGFLERRNSKIYTPSLNSARDHSISET